MYVFIQSQPQSANMHYAVSQRQKQLVVMDIVLNDTHTNKTKKKGHKHTLSFAWTVSVVRDRVEACAKTSPHLHLAAYKTSMLHTYQQ